MQTTRTATCDVHERRPAAAGGNVLLRPPLPLPHHHPHHHDHPALSARSFPPRLPTSSVDSKNGGFVIEKSKSPSSSLRAVKSGPGASSSPSPSPLGAGTSRTEILSCDGVEHTKRGWANGRREKGVYAMQASNERYDADVSAESWTGGNSVGVPSIRPWAGETGVPWCKMAPRRTQHTPGTRRTVNGGGGAGGYRRRKHCRASPRRQRPHHEKSTRRGAGTATTSC